MNHCVFQRRSPPCAFLARFSLPPSLRHLLFLTPSLRCLTTAPSGTCTIKNSSPPSSIQKRITWSRATRSLHPPQSNQVPGGAAGVCQGESFSRPCSSHSISSESAASQGPVATMRVFRNNDGKGEAGGHWKRAEVAAVATAVACVSDRQPAPRRSLHPAPSSFAASRRELGNQMH